MSNQSYIPDSSNFKGRKRLLVLFYKETKIFFPFCTINQLEDIDLSINFEDLQKASIWKSRETNEERYFSHLQGRYEEFPHFEKRLKELQKPYTIKQIKQIKQVEIKKKPVHSAKSIPKFDGEEIKFSNKKSYPFNKFIPVGRTQAVVLCREEKNGKVISTIKEKSLDEIFSNAEAVKADIFARGTSRHIKNLYLFYQISPAAEHIRSEIADYIIPEFKQLLAKRDT